MIGRERFDDAYRDTLALVTAVAAGDGEAVEAIIDAQDGEGWPLVVTAVGMLIAVVADAGHDPREWAAAARERQQARQP